MFFKKIFGKNFKHYKEKGDKYLEEERYADARHEYLEALGRLDDCDDPAEAKMQVLRQLAVTGDKLALLNITEAGFALTVGDAVKAGDHLRLAKELAENPEILQQAARLEMRLEQSAPPPVAAPAKGHSCGGCGSSPAEGGCETAGEADQLVAEDRYAFLLHTLPESLRARYSAMGERFAAAYLAAHEGKDQEGLALYQELSREDQNNDILLYETAIIYFKHGDLPRCEQLLRKALELNPANELCCLGIVQLLVETGRALESIKLLEHMIAEKIMGGQAVLSLGDVLILLGDESRAMETLLPALKMPGMAKAAAERLIPLLEKQNRRDEAAYLFKTHMKGCC